MPPNLTDSQDINSHACQCPQLICSDGPLPTALRRLGLNSSPHSESERSQKENLPRHSSTQSPSVACHHEQSYKE